MPSHLVIDHIRLAPRQLAKHPRYTHRHAKRANKKRTLALTVNSNHCPARVLTRLKSPKQKPRLVRRGSAKLHSLYYAASSTDRIFLAGSLNHAMVGPFPREIPRASVFKLG